MGLREWKETLIVAKSSGTAHGASTSQVSIIPTAAVKTIPANYWEVGKKLRVNFAGRMSNIVTTPGTATLEIKNGSVVVFSSGALQLNATAKTNVTVKGHVDLTCFSEGSGTSATIMGVGKIESESFSAAATGVGVKMMPETAPAVGTGFDSTSSGAFNLFWTWSVNDAGNTVQLHGYDVEALN